MGTLIAYDNSITSIFQLMGTRENDITKSVAWAYSQCPSFLKFFIDEIFEIDSDPEKISIAYQQWEKKKGITDLEITDDNLFYAIIEAKRGWQLPEADQLMLYSERKKFRDSKAGKKAIITMSECSTEYADTYLPVKSVDGIPIKHISYKRIYEICKKAVKESNNAQKHLLTELMGYFRGIMRMQNVNSNWVYIVSLSYRKAEGSALSYIDIVEKKGKYYHPFGINGWPKEAPNYVAFRYNGKLQSIHHIEDCHITRKMHEYIPELPDEEWDSDHLIYELGPAIRPNKIVKTGNIYANGRKWAMLDLLLTSDTISEACDLSAQRTNS